MVEISEQFYTDFIFINRFGNAQGQSTLNKTIKRIIRNCNDEALTMHKGKAEFDYGG